MNVGYTLHLPVSAKEAKAQQLPNRTGSLLIFPDQPADLLSAQAEILFAAKGDSRYFVATLLNPFVGHRDLQTRMETAGLAYRFDTDVSDRPKKPHDVLICCHTLQDIRTVLSFSAEEIAFCCSDNFEDKPDLLAILVDASFDWPSVIGFMRYLHAIPLFLFFSSTHDSIEILGTCEAVDQLYRRLRTEQTWTWTVPYF